MLFLLNSFQAIVEMGEGPIANTTHKILKFIFRSGITEKHMFLISML